MGRTSVTVVMCATTCALTLALAACGSLSPKLDQATIERGVERDARAQFAGTGAVVGAAHCPANRAQRKGDSFDCHVTIDHQDAVYRVHQTDGHGTVQPTFASQFLLFSTIDDQVLAELRRQGLTDSRVACGYAHVWIVTPPVTRDCVVTLTDHSTHNAHVSIAADGGVDKVVVAGLA